MSLTKATSTVLDPTTGKVDSGSEGQVLEQQSDKTLSWVDGPLKTVQASGWLSEETQSLSDFGITDLNDVNIKPGVYHAYTTVNQNRPSGAANGTIIHYSRVNNHQYAAQKYIEWSGKSWERTKTGGTWTDWKENFSTPIGSVLPYAGAVAPYGWLLCDGSAISRTNYAPLFAVIGTSYGVGDSSTTFNIPDLRGEFMRGADNGRGVDSGRTLGSFQNDEFKSHNHNIIAATDESDVGPKVRGGGTSATTGTVVTEATGGTETRPRNIAMNFIIRY